MYTFLLYLLLIHTAESVTNQQLFDLEIGGPVLLNCTLSGDLKWEKLTEVDKPVLIRGDERRYKLSSDNHILTIEDPKKNIDEGDYTCSSSSSSKEIFRVRGKPEFSTFKADGHTKDMNSFNVIQDADLHLVCEVLMRAAFEEDVVNFVWYRILPNGNEEVITDLNITTAEDSGGSYITKKSILFLDDVKYSDRAQYICEASNGPIKANSTVNVRVKDKLAALWPFLGIVAEVITLCTVICIYEQRRGKSEFEESDGKTPSKSPAHSK